MEILRGMVSISSGSSSSSLVEITQITRKKMSLEVYQTRTTRVTLLSSNNITTMIQTKNNLYRIRMVMSSGQVKTASGL
jgi:hypothetical protein